MDGVREQRDRPRRHGDDPLQEGGRAEDDEAGAHRADAVRTGLEGGIRGLGRVVAVRPDHMQHPAEQTLVLVAVLVAVSGRLVAVLVAVLVGPLVGLAVVALVPVLVARCRVRLRAHAVMVPAAARPVEATRPLRRGVPAPSVLPAPADGS